MKKLLFMTVLFLGMMNLKAQDMHFGIKAAYSSTKFDGDFDSGDKSAGKTNFELGGVAEFILNDQIAIAPELNYVGAGDVVKHERYGNKYAYTFSLTYIQIPVMLKYYVNENISLNAGPQIGFLMSAAITEEVTKENGDIKTNTHDNKEYMNSTDFGLNIGGSYKMENGLFFDLRYYIGMSNIIKTDSNSFVLKNKGFKLGIGYYFN